MDGGEVKPEASTTDAPPSGTVEEQPGEGEAQHVSMYYYVYNPSSVVGSWSSNIPLVVGA